MVLYTTFVIHCEWYPISDKVISQVQFHLNMCVWEARKSSWHLHLYLHKVPYPPCSLALPAEQTLADIIPHYLAKQTTLHFNKTLAAPLVHFKWNCPEHNLVPKPVCNHDIVLTGDWKSECNFVDLLGKNGKFVFNLGSCGK